MKIDIKMLDESKVDYDWKTLYVGISSNIIDYKELTIYAVKVMESDEYEYDEFICELAWGVEEYLESEILTKMLLNFKYEKLIPETEIWEFEMRKLRYTLLNYLNSSIDNDEELLDNVEKVYADFNYPVDMEEFIYYMHSKKRIQSNSVEENRKYMIEELERFLAEEKRYINKFNS